jgi:predicted NBD/HSP70 family sugar kinase
MATDAQEHHRFFPAYRVGQLLRRHGPLTVQALELRSGIPRRTIGDQLARLDDLGLARRREEKIGKQVVWELRPDAATVIGVLADQGGAVGARLNLHVEPDAIERDSEFRLVNGYPDGVDRLAALIERLLPSKDTGPGLLGIGVALPAPIMRHTGTPASPFHLSGWNTSIAKALSGTLAKRQIADPLVIENDASAGALGVYTTQTYAQPGQAARDLIFVRVMAGIGAGIIARGQLLGGVSGLAGEIGHTQIRADGLPCPRCGRRGCLETVASAEAIRRNLIGTRHWGSKPPPLPTMLNDDHPAINQELRQAGTLLGIALSHAVHVLNPEQIVLAGPVVGHDAYLDAVRGSLNQSVVPHSAVPIERLASSQVPIEVAGVGARVVQDHFDAFLHKLLST